MGSHLWRRTTLLLQSRVTQIRIIRYLSGLVLLVAIYLTSRYNYVLFHSLVEIFGVVVAAGVFSIVWNARGYFRNNYLLLVGMALLPVALVDILHTLAYQGLDIFTGYDNDLPTQLWLVGRYLQVGAFLSAPFVLRRQGRAWLYLASFITITVVLVTLVFSRLFPAAYVVGSGLTAFKITSEYVIAALLILSLTLLIRARKSFERGVFAFLAAAIVLTVGSEMLFTLYISPYGPSNLAGHLVKLLAFYLIYKAVIETALTRPYSLIFRELKQSEETLRDAEAQQRHIADVLQEALLTVPRKVPGLVVGHIYQPAAIAGRVGGDFYDVFTLPNGGVGLVIGDVSGHGLEAAALTAVSKSTMKAFAMEGLSPGAVLHNTNLVMLQTLGSDDGVRSDFLTSFCAVLEPSTGALRYAAAGHPPAMIRRRSGEIAILECRSPVVGVFEDAAYSDHSQHLDPGDVLLLYTDGLPEARLDGKLLGEQKIIDFLAANTRISAAELPSTLYQDLIEQMGYDRQDDLAILTVELAAPGPQNGGPAG